MAYITKANARMILKKINISDVRNVEGDVYKKPIFFLSKWEIKFLLSMQSLLRNPQNFFIEVYKPIELIDKFQYVFEGDKQPSYHLKKDCDRLTSNFKNFKIPFEIKSRIKEKGEENGLTYKEINILITRQVNTFRVWFKKKLEIFNNDPERFIKKLEIRWNVKRRIEEIEMGNSGVEYIENLDLFELEQKIDTLLRETAVYFNTNEDKQSIIRRFQKLTFLAYSDQDIKLNDTELFDKDLKEFLRYYDQKFKKPVKKLLLEYYRVKYNPELSFDGKLLEQLNFLPCLSCHQN